MRVEAPIHLIITYDLVNIISYSEDENYYTGICIFALNFRTICRTVEVVSSSIPFAFQMMWKKKQLNDASNRYKLGCSKEKKDEEQQERLLEQQSSLSNHLLLYSLVMIIITTDGFASQCMNCRLRLNCQVIII